MKKFLTLAALTASALISMSATEAVAAGASQRDVVLDTRGNAVFTTQGNCVRTRWYNGGDECGAPETMMQTTVVQPRRLALEERTVYFPFNQASLTPESRARLDTLANVLKSDRSVREAKIVGYADRIGSTSYNEQLSKKRAQAVQNYLTSRGLLNTRVTDVRWFGENAPRTNCPDSMERQELIACLQTDRRVEVEVEYVPQPYAQTSMNDWNARR